jgi:hypothetical protein
VNFISCPGQVTGAGSPVDDPVSACPVEPVPAVTSPVVEPGDPEVGAAVPLALSEPTDPSELVDVVAPVAGPPVDAPVDALAPPVAPSWSP